MTAKTIGLTDCHTCVIGMIGSKEIRSGDWEKATQEFSEIIADFNEKTKHYAIPHPGFEVKFSYCPYCGKAVEG